MKVGFIGLGKMGQAMADRILGGGHDLMVWNRTPAKAADLVRRGAKHGGSLGEVARHGEIVVTMLENDAALDTVAGGPDGLIANMAPSAIHLMMGSHSIALVTELVGEHTTAGTTLVGAPVLGRPPVAAAGQLGIITAGDPAAVARCKPLFDLMGRRTFDAGTDPVAAAAAKIANNFVLVCAIEALSEGFALAEKNGVPPAGLLDILTDGLFASPAYKVYGKLIAEKGYLGEPGFTVTTGLKDVNLALAAGESAGVPLPSGSVVRDRLVTALAHGLADRDWSSLALEQRRASGMED